MIKTGSVYGLDNSRSGGEVRLLVTRYWPRGVKKQAVDIWLKELGTETSLITEWKNRRIVWEEFSSRYAKGLKREEAVSALIELRSIIDKAENSTVTLLCTCKEGQRHCHRELLKGLIEGG